MSDYNNKGYEAGKNAQSDAKGERMMDRFLVDKVYPELVRMGIAKKITSVTDKELQEAGVDATWEMEDGSVIYVDNKTRCSVLNTASAAVPFELITSDTNGDNRHEGWFTLLSGKLFKDKAHLTDYVLFIHPYSKDRKQTDFNEIKYSDIRTLDVLMVRVDEVFKYLEEYYKLTMEDICEKTVEFDHEYIKQTKGMSEDELKFISRKCADGFERGIRDRVNNKGEEYTSYDAVIHTSARSYMPEDPVNLLIREDVCKTFPHTRHFVFDVYKGLSEFYDIKERRELSKKDDTIG